MLRWKWNRNPPAWHETDIVSGPRGSRAIPLRNPVLRTTLPARRPSVWETQRRTVPPGIVRLHREVVFVSRNSRRRPTPDVLTRYQQRLHLRQRVSQVLCNALLCAVLARTTRWEHLGNFWPVGEGCVGRSGQVGISRLFTCHGSICVVEFTFVSLVIST